MRKHRVKNNYKTRKGFHTAAKKTHKKNMTHQTRGGYRI